jgi:hypothetical protein
MKPRTLVIAIAGVAIGFSMRNAVMLGRIKKRYAGYLTSRRPHIVLECRYTRTQRFGVSERVTMTRISRTVRHAQRRDFDCRWRGPAGTLSLSPSIYSFDACLRVLLATLLPSHGTILVHAASVAARKRAYVFPGKSGSGKTTISRLAGDGTVLNDEISAISVESGHVRVWGTPFWGEMGSGPPHNRPSRMYALCFLRKSRNNHLTALTGSEALQRLLRCVCLFGTDTDDIGAVLDIAGRIVDATQIGILSFRKTPEVWEFLDSPDIFRKPTS